MATGNAFSPTRDSPAVLPLAVLYSDGYLAYDFGHAHALREVRVRLACELIRSSGLFDGRATLLNPTPALEESILRVHERRYVDAVKQLGMSPKEEAYEFGLGPGDNPIFPGMYESSALQAGGTVQACELVATGQRARAYNLGGGFHHAMPSKASGFCIFNDVAIGLKHILDRGLVHRVLYVDIDAHHGDGVQHIFYDDPRVLTISLHEDGRFLFPGTGFTDEIGQGNGRGYAVNVPLPPYTRDASYLYAVTEIVPPLARAYRPDLVFTQTGADATYLDPLAHLKLTSRTYEAFGNLIDGLTQELCASRWVAATGGGYDVAACARMWTLIASTMAGVDLPNPIDARWRELCRSKTGSAPATLRDVDVASGGERVTEAVREVVADVKTKVFPLHGL